MLSEMMDSRTSSQIVRWKTNLRTTARLSLRQAISAKEMSSRQLPPFSLGSRKTRVALARAVTRKNTSNKESDRISQIFLLILRIRSSLLFLRCLPQRGSSRGSFRGLSLLKAATLRNSTRNMNPRKMLKKKKSVLGHERWSSILLTHTGLKRRRIKR